MKWYQHPAIEITIWWVPNAIVLSLLVERFGIVAAFMAAISATILGLLLVQRQNNKRIQKAIADLQEYGNDAAHHMQYGIDQTLRDLMGMEAYRQWRVELVMKDFTWEEGIAP